MTTKAKYDAMAADYDAKAEAELKTYATLVAAFGGSSEVALGSEKLMRDYQENARFWRWIGKLHPRSRARALADAR